MKNFFKNESGPSTTEYAILLSLIVLTAIGAIKMLGLSMSGIFSSFGQFL